MSSRGLRIVLAVAVATAGLWFVGAPASGQRGPVTTVPFDPSVSVSATDDLVDGQIVDVEGTGFETTDPVLVYLCHGSPEGEELCPAQLRIGNTATEPDGSFTTRVQIRVMAFVDSFPPDCREVICHLLVTNGHLPDDTEGRPQVAIPLSFDPDGPPLGQPRVSVTPEVELDDGEVVAVEGAGFVLCQAWTGDNCDPPQDIGFCRTDAWFDECAAVVSERLVGVGTFRADVALPVIGRDSSGEYDCRDVSCSIVVQRHDDTIVVPIEFASDETPTTTTSTTSTTAVLAPPAQPVDAAPTFTG